ncbi:alginate lyase family protein [Knoellia sp. CPCC 206450]|uniref:alginate lyase family protein n=1 Tax=Knoellia tibetensis TaxID=3404798 RepID=UPI003B42A729
MTWYAQRLRRMSAAEVTSRVGDRAQQLTWTSRRVRPGEPFPPPARVLALRPFTTTLAAGARTAVPPEAALRLVTAADRVLEGNWRVLGTYRRDSAAPDWFLDPVTGRRAPHDALAFGVDHRNEQVTGNVKSVWELSRHHHLTVLAGAWWVSGEDAYAEAAAAQLRSWWATNPFLSGVHWTSGIELGVRLMSWVWVRRLLDDWPGVAALFEDDPVALNQLRWHQEYLAAFRSHGSSANNHLVAEAAGRLAAACAFPWFAESEGWRRTATQQLEHALASNTFPSGVNREMATDYQRFTTELGLVALVEADAAGHPLSSSTRELLERSLDAGAALLDAAGNPPRQGDGDEGRALVLDDPDDEPWTVLLASGAATLGPASWWPPVSSGVTSTLLHALSQAAGSSAATTEAMTEATTEPTTAATTITVRGGTRPQHFADAGVTVLRSAGEHGAELWCRCDGGPHGFLSIAAHGHADALSVEVRHDGVELLVDPGTYCYHGEPEWRDYFRSTRAHNTVEVGGADQCVQSGPFMWATHADAVTGRTELRISGTSVWEAHHTAYARLDPALRHDRRVELDGPRKALTVTDTVTGSRSHSLKLSWHLGPHVHAELGPDGADLWWTGRDGHDRQGRLLLPGVLAWTAHRGENDPVVGWTSPRFGVRVPATSLVGVGTWTGTLELRTELVVHDEPAVQSRTARERTGRLW